MGWLVARRELRGCVFSFPSLSFGDGAKEQEGPGWDVGITGCWSFPPIRPVLHGVDRLDAGLLEQLPNEFAVFGAVVIEVAKRTAM